MKKHITAAVAVLLCTQIFAQKSGSGRWTDWFSYNNILAVKQDGERIVAATDSGIFYYTPATGEIAKLSKANGLHEIGITAFDYNASTRTGLIGYSSGSLDVITPEGVFFVVDVPLSAGYSGNKRINHISIDGNRAVVSIGYDPTKISAAYAVAIFDLTKREFGQSVILNEPAVEAAIKTAPDPKEDLIYVATKSGIKSHKNGATFPIYSDWTLVQPGNFTQIALGGDLVYSNENSVYLNGTAIGSFEAVKDISLNGSNITVADSKKVTVFSGSTPKKTFDAKESLNTANFIDNKIYAGTALSGILDEEGKAYRPDGPYANTSYKLSVKGGKIWVATGQRTDRYNNPVLDTKNLGFYHYTGTQWVYPSFFKYNQMPFVVLDVVYNPSDLSDVFFTNYSFQDGQGIYRMQYKSEKNDFDLVKFVDVHGDFYLNRPVGMTFDNSGNLFVTSSGYTGPNNGLLRYDLASNSYAARSLAAAQAVQKPVFADGLLFIPAPSTNLFVVNDLNGTPQNLNDDRQYILRTANGLPSNAAGTISVAIDKSGDAWIGTDHGLRILPSAVSAIKTPDPKVEPVIIEQNGIGEELFRDRSILQVEVDTGNQKWVSVEGGGVFYLSPDGQKTMTHFTKSNSPLPSDDVTDVKVDTATGKVYFATYNGIVVYQGDVANVSEEFSEVVVYPNPVVYANYKGSVKIRGLAEQTNLRITDAVGNLVHQGVARGGYYEWNLNNLRGNRVASGIYYVLMTNSDASRKATAKIAVVN